MNEDPKRANTSWKSNQRQQIASKKVMKNGKTSWLTGMLWLFSAIVYLIVVFILINGFEVDYSKEEIISFYYSVQQLELWSIFQCAFKD